MSGETIFGIVNTSCLGKNLLVDLYIWLRASSLFRGATLYTSLPMGFLFMKQPKLQVGDIVVNPRNGFRRLIRDVSLSERGFIYSYYNEEIDEKYEATGNFNIFSIGVCSENHLLRWGNKV